jgi:hypothetical protein
LATGATAGAGADEAPQALSPKNAIPCKIACENRLMNRL